MEIIPAILPKNFSEIVEKIELIKGLIDIVQIDICDGKYVSSVTWPYWKSEIKVDENFEAILKEERGMPEWERIDYEFDLMIENPNADDARKWLSAGAKRIVLHLDSSKDLNSVIDVLNGLVDIGIAINLNSKIDEINKYINKIQFIQIMGIRKAGFQGQKFEPDTINKIKEVKIAFPNIKIQIDGGVSLENALLLKHEGANTLIVGSALFNSDNLIHSLNQFKQI